MPKYKHNQEINHEHFQKAIDTINIGDPEGSYEHFHRAGIEQDTGIKLTENLAILISQEVSSGESDPKDALLSVISSALVIGIMTERARINAGGDPIPPNYYTARSIKLPWRFRKGE